MTVIREQHTSGIDKQAQAGRAIGRHGDGTCSGCRSHVSPAISEHLAGHSSTAVSPGGSAPKQAAGWRPTHDTTRRRRRMMAMSTAARRTGVRLGRAGSGRSSSARCEGRWRGAGLPWRPKSYIECVVQQQRSRRAVGGVDRGAAGREAAEGSRADERVTACSSKPTATGA